MNYIILTASFKKYVKSYVLNIFYCMSTHPSKNSVSILSHTIVKTENQKYKYFQDSKFLYDKKCVKFKLRRLY